MKQVTVLCWDYDTAGNGPTRGSFNKTFNGDWVDISAVSTADEIGYSDGIVSKIRYHEGGAAGHSQIFYSKVAVATLVTAFNNS